MSESSKTWALTVSVVLLLLMTFQVDVHVSNTIGPDRVVRRPILRAAWDIVTTTAAAVSLFLNPLARDTVADTSGARYFASQEIPPEPVIRAVGPSGQIVLNNAEGW